jgi:hypothetical protein
MNSVSKAEEFYTRMTTALREDVGFRDGVITKPWGRNVRYGREVMKIQEEIRKSNYASDQFEFDHAFKLVNQGIVEGHIAVQIDV